MTDHRHITSNVRPIDPERLRRIFDQPVDYPIFSHNTPPTWGERICNALESPRFVLFYLGFYTGCFATVALAALWTAL